MEGSDRILVVDDEAVIRELMTEILSEDGYSVATAPNAREALDLLRQNGGFVLMFTDIMMPEMDGISLVREAKQIAPDLIPIVMTGYATLETARAAVREGAYDYVLKPFSLGDIKLAVANALERYRLTNENARLRELTELFRISETIASFHEERGLLEFVLKTALERVKARRGSLMLTTEDGRALELAASVGVPSEHNHTVVQVGNGIAGMVAASRAPLLVKNIKHDPELQSRSQRLDDASFMSVPLERKAAPNGSAGPYGGDKPRVLAVLNVNEKIEGHFTDADLKVLSILANHAAAAIENVRLIRDIQAANLSTLQSMALLLEAKDAYTHGHSQRVRNYSCLAADRMGLSKEDIQTLHVGAMLHDIGKIGVKDEVLNKTERLTNDEWEMIKRHPVIGYDVLAGVPMLTKEHLAVVRSHHERLDGSGYPDGLKGDEQSTLVRIIAVADSYDAMSSSRAYRKAMGEEKIISEIKRCMNTQLDGVVAKLFVELIESGEIRRHA